MPVRVILFYILILLMVCLEISAGQTLRFDVLLDEALTHSYDLKAADYELEIKKNSRIQAFISRLPELTAGVSSAYMETLRDKPSYFDTENNDFSSENQRYGNTISVEFSYTLFDYGQAEKRHRASRIDEQIAMFNRLDVIQTLKLRVLSTFTEALSLYQQIGLKRQMAGVYDAMIVDLEKTVISGQSSRMDVAVQQKNKARVEYDILMLEQRFAQTLSDLTLLTGRPYRADEAEPAGLECGLPGSLEFEYKSQPGFLMKEKELEMKAAELSVIQAEFFPKLDLKVNYKYYGSDPDKYGKSFEDLDDESYSVGLFTSVAFSKTAKNYFAFKSGLREVEKSRALLAKKQAELQNRFSRYKIEYRFLNRLLELDRRRINMVDETLEMLERLRKQGLAGSRETWEEKLSLLEEKMMISRDIVSRSSAVKWFEIIAQGTGHLSENTKRDRFDE